MPVEPMLQRVAIAKTLLSKTLAGEIEWELTPQKGVFQVPSSQYVIRVKRRLYEDPSGEEQIDFILQIFNDAGLLVDEFDDNQLKRLGYENSWNEMGDLYESARRMALKVNEVLDSVLESLNKESEKKPRPSAKNDLETL